MFKKISDKSIIEGIRNQDDAMLNWLYDNYFPVVRKHILNNSGTTDDVSDIFQDSVIILYNQICDNTLTLTSDLKGYFFGIARNRWKEHLRVRKVTVALDENIPDESPDEELTDPFFERIVTRAFKKLNREHQQILTLFSNGHSYVEMAKKLKLGNETNARRRKYMSKEALMELVREDPEYQEYLRFLK